MPILVKDIDVSPPNLLDSECLQNSENRWYALRTKPRQEKVLLRRLDSDGKSFCGLLIPNRRRMSSGRITTSHIPLFPGYVFLWGGEVDRYDAVCTNCVVQVLNVFDGETLRRDLRQIQLAIQSGTRVTLADRLERGQVVRVVSGPLAGLNGVYLNKKGKCRLILSLSFIQRSAMVEIDDAVVEAA